MTVIKPELTLSCLKESKKYFGAECPVGTFIVRLYWSDYSKYAPSDRKLDGVHLLYDNKVNFNRVCEFAITSLESLEYLVANCNPPTHSDKNKENWFKRQTAYALMKFCGFAKTAYQFIKPIKVVVQTAVAQVKQTVSKAVQSVGNAVKNVFRRAPRNWDDCKSAEDIQYIFDRTPLKFRTDGFVARYLAAYDKFVPSVQPIPYVSMFNVAELIAAKNIRPIKVGEALADVPQYGLSLDDIVFINYIPGEVKMEVEHEHIPASDRQVRKMMADGYKANARRCKQWVIGVGKSIPGYQVIVKSSDKRKAEIIMQQVVENILLANLSVLELSDIITGS
jgi:hypothetical protein